jgi:L-rhamnose isomerase/sugar isomerase
VDAEECLRSAFWLEVRSIIAEWRKSKGLPEDPMKAFRESGYLERVTRERRDRHTGAAASYA